MVELPILDLLQDSCDPPLSHKSIEDLQFTLGFRFPDDYRDFLLQFNGGHFRRIVEFDIPEPTMFVTGGLVKRFFGEPNDGFETQGIVTFAEEFGDRLPDNYLAIADCNSQDLLLLRFDDLKTDFQGVWFWNSDAYFDPDEQSMYWLAESFSAFLEMLVCDFSFDKEVETLPLFQEVERGNLRAVKQHLAAGGDPNARNDDGKTLLESAADHQWPKLARLLLESGADPNARDNLGRTPLYYAARGSVDCVRMFLAAGADAKARDNNGESVLANWSHRADQMLRAHGAVE